MIITQGKLISSSAQINPGTILNTDIADNEITNAKISPTAAIAQSKLALAITDAEVAAGAAITDTKLAQITSAGKVSGAALTLLGDIPSSAGVIPSANVPTITFEQLGTTELSAAGATLEVTGLSARRFLLVVAHIVAQSGADEIVVRFNGDSAANYSLRRSSDGSADVTAVSQSGLGLTGWGGTEKWLVMHIANRSATRKNIIGELHVAGSASAAPDRMEFVGVWDNTAAQITQVSLIAGGTTTFGIGSRIAVYGSSITG